MYKTVLAAFVAAVWLCAGCQDTVNTVENADKTMTPDTIRDARFITDGFLRDRLALKSLTVSETPDGFKRAQLAVVNVRTGALAQAWSGMTGENPYPIRYKFTWFTQDGMAVDTLLSDWQRVTIIPGETLYLQSVAPNRDCKDFQISLKEAR